MTAAADELSERLRERLRAIEDNVRARTGESPQHLFVPPVFDVEIAAAELELNISLPSEVSALYRVTNLVECFHSLIHPVERLAEINELAAMDMDEVFTDFGDLVWGPRPQGDVVVLSNDGPFVTLCEVDGPSVGRLSALDVRDDFGYRFLAESVERLLDAWVAATKLGLFELLIDKTVAAREIDEPQLRDLATEYGVGPAAFGIHHLTPGQVARMKAGEPDFWLD